MLYFENERKKLYIYMQLLLKHILERCKGSESHEHLEHYTYIVVAIAKFMLGVELETEKQALLRALNEWLIPLAPCWSHLHQEGGC